MFRNVVKQYQGTGRSEVKPYEASEPKFPSLAYVEQIEEKEIVR
jgi:hypothetical protein